MVILAKIRKFGEKFLCANFHNSTNSDNYVVFVLAIREYCRL
jgi:hypothetical protein